MEKPSKSDLINDAVEAVIKALQYAANNPDMAKHAFKNIQDLKDDWADYFSDLLDGKISD